jgi:hypothetical protein
MLEQIHDMENVRVETDGTMDLCASLASDDMPSFLKTRERLLTIQELLEKSRFG